MIYVGSKRRIMPHIGPLLRAVRPCCAHYQEVLPSNATVYLDPPYRSTVGYEATIDYDDFYTYCRSLHERGNKVYISEYDMPGDFTEVWRGEIPKAFTGEVTKSAAEKLYTLC